MRALLILASLLLGACATAHKADYSSERFTIAARSWLGADIREMASIWGTPTRQTQSSSEDASGIAHWRFGFRNASATGSNVNNYRCDVDAFYDAEGIITRVDVSAIRCDHRFADELPGLTR